MTNSETIFHYTTISGLIGIITHSELWASDCRLLNDGTELTYAQEIFLYEVRELNLEPLMDGGYIVAGPLLDYFRMYLTCFCEDGDLLSQWRGYGVDQGYALGFNTAELQAHNIGEICPVQYGISNPKGYFSDELANAVQPTAHPGMEDWHASRSLLPRLARVKHPSFSEEREWRLLVPSFGLPKEGTSVHFRESPMSPIPYLAITIPKESLRKIIIGPGNHAQTRLAAVGEMLQYHEYKDVDVRVSKVPFRN
jgi:hypothetical protein